MTALFGAVVIAGPLLVAPAAMSAPVSGPVGARTAAAPAFGAPSVAKRSPTVVTGWARRPRVVAAGQRMADRVRIRTGGQGIRRKVALQRAESGTTQWSRVWLRRTDSRGRLTVKFRAPGDGEWKYRVRIRSTRAAVPVRSQARLIRIRTSAAPTDESSAAPAPPQGDPVSPPQAAPAEGPLPVPTSATPDPVVGETVFVAGDIGLSPSSGGAPDDTADLLDPDATAVVVPGDLAYPNGTTSDFADNYDPYWGPFRAMTYPVPGNHEYNSGATAYFAYFGSRVGTLADPWYTVDIGSWRFFMLNSNCGAVGGCAQSDPQYDWLAAQLAQPLPACTAAVWHHPRWSSGQHGPYAGTADMYQLLADHGTDLLLTGHEHNYERFAAMSAAGAVDPAGIREFVVGTGGQTLRPFAGTAAGSQVRLNDSRGVLRMQLGEDAYSWQFLPTEPGGATDTGSDSCT